MKARPQVQAFVAGSTPKIERPPGYLGAVGTGGSVLLAGLVHMGLNGVTPLMAGVDADLSWALRAVVAAAIALAVIALGGFGRSNVGSSAVVRPASPS